MLKNFRLQVLVRVSMIVITLAVCIYIALTTAFYISVGLFALLAIYQSVRLIHYVEQTNRKLSQFLNSIRYSDFSRSFSSRSLGPSFRNLDESFARVVDAFKKQRIEKQVQFRYMQTVVRHIGIGLISFTSTGDVELLNTAAKRLFQIPTLRNIKELKNISPALFDAVNSLEGEKKNVVQVSINNRMMQLAIHATTFRLRDEMYKLVSFQDINPELEDKEMEAWQNLTQVMTHEIMNSVTPIASLSDTVQMLLKSNIQEQDNRYLIDNETVTDVTEALETIENRSRGLIRFVNSYRDFTKIPEPAIKLFNIGKLLRRVQNLNKGEAAAQNISIVVSVDPESLEVSADPHLIEQVLINLIKNAFRALSDRNSGTIHLYGEIQNGSVCILVHDDGPGIPPENLDKIFIPFYSTGRNHEGSSGIGLSLSRQIMRAHGGTIAVKSSAENGTTFTLQF